MTAEQEIEYSLNEGECFERSSLLSDAGFRHAFFTRKGGVSSPPYDSLNFTIATGDEPECLVINMERAADVLKVEPWRLYFLSQVHGNECFKLGGDELQMDIFEQRGDALFSRNPEAACGVRVADCVPILVGDPQTGAAMAIHAGWRGLASGVIESSLTQLAALGSDPSRWVVAIGPHISQAAFEVSDELAEQLVALTAAPQSEVVDRSKARLHISLRRIATEQLLRQGVLEAHLESVGGCTLSSPDNYYSYRRDGENSGRHLAAIVPLG